MAFRLTTYFKEAREELRKVVWPTRLETRNNTLMVIGISIFVMTFLGLIDLGLNYLLEQFFIR